jgi:L-threonylcarbamoyladenylate synthase
MIRLRLDLSLELGPQLAPAVEAVRRGEVVGFPTDTLYGLAADPRNPRAVAAVLALKGRDADHAVALIASSLAQAETLVVLGPAARRLAERFWPGPLTLVVPASTAIVKGVRSATGTIGIRVADHAVARALCDACGHPLTATSANRSGAPATADPDAVARQLPALAVLVDGGPTAGGLPSTLVDASTNDVRLLRDGAVPWSRVLEFLGAPSRSA